MYQEKKDIDEIDNKKDRERLEIGVWNGKYFGVNGKEGRIILTIETAIETIEGHCKVVIRGKEKPQIYESDVKGTLKTNFVNFDLSFQNEKSSQGMPKKMEWKGSVFSAYPFAMQAICGTTFGPIGSDLSSGVWIAWKFKQSKE